ncbi:MAG: hypothetical protein KBS60_01365 [Phascolarctobacterium sp.]|nr:hypothetical protein [Candidatus Phascolarctobacterium caballi]
MENKFKYEIGKKGVISLDDDPKMSKNGVIVARSYNTLAKENCYCIRYDDGCLITDFESNIVEEKDWKE